VDNRNRNYSSALTRQICSQIGGDLSNKAWARLRLIVGCSNRHSLTQLEAFLLWVGATRCRGRNNLTKAEILREGAAIAGQAQQIFSLTGAELTAAQLRDAIAAATGGWRPSEQTLYTWGRSPKMPVYQRGKTYTTAQATLFVNRALRRRS
jgi:hypothetical protein